MIRLSLLAVVCGVVACKKEGESVSGPARPRPAREAFQKQPRKPSAGKRKLEGSASELRASPDGRVVTVLVDAEKPRLEGVPPTVLVGALWVVPTGEEAPFKVANGATNSPGGLLFTNDGAYLLSLGAFDPTQQAGELIVQDLRDLAAERQRIAPKVTYFKPSPDGRRLAYVDEGVLFEGSLPSGPFRQLAGEVATAEFAPDGKNLYFRRRSVAGGGLFQIDLSAAKPVPRRFVDAVGEYAISEDSKWVIAMARTNPRQFGFELFVADTAALKPVRVADDVMRFAISRDGQWMARIQLPKDVATNASAASDLQVAELWVGRTGTTQARKVGNKVREFEFTSDSKQLVFRDNYRALALVGGKVDEKVGDLSSVTLPDGAPKLIQKRCPNYELSPDGATLAFTVRVEKPEYSRHLFVLQGDKGPVKLQEWLYDYAFTTKSDRLLFRANCTREGRSCDLMVQDLTQVGVVKPARAIAETFNFKLSGDGSHAVTTSAHVVDEYFDAYLTDLKSGESKLLDQFVTQPVHFLNQEGTKAAWIVAEKQTAGVYVGP